MNEPKTIVAEISKNWISGDRAEDCLSGRFEEVIAVNARRGYTLKDWRFAQVLVPADDEFRAVITETIIAVFEANP